MQLGIRTGHRDYPIPVIIYMIKNLITYLFIQRTYLYIIPLMTIQMMVFFR